MRISDWSSDVCSSDLATTGGSDRNARLLPGDLTRTAVAAQLRHRLVREAETVQTTGADLAAEGVQRQLAIERDALTAFDVLAAVADLAETQRVDRRSEEHTSELQSLMRISYADFCLTQRNRKSTRLNSSH